MLTKLKVHSLLDIKKNPFLADGGIFCVWDACPNYKAQGSAHLYNIETLRSRSAADIDEAVIYLKPLEFSSYVFIHFINSSSKRQEKTSWHGSYFPLNFREMRLLEKTLIKDLLESLKRLLQLF